MRIAVVWLDGVFMWYGFKMGLLKTFLQGCPRVTFDLKLFVLLSWFLALHFCFLLDLMRWGDCFLTSWLFTSPLVRSWIWLIFRPWNIIQLSLDWCFSACASTKDHSLLSLTYLEELLGSDPLRNKLPEKFFNTKTLNFSMEMPLPDIVSPEIVFWLCPLMLDLTPEALLLLFRERHVIN